MDHDHTWEPVPEFFGRYACTCGATGHKPISGEDRGKILAHKTSQRLTEKKVTHVGNPNMSNGNARRGKRGPGGW